MKTILSILIIMISFGQMLRSQTVVSQGKPVAEIFADFHYNIDDTTKTTGFGINRAHLGYNFLPGNDFSATIIVNIGTPEDLAPGSVSKRYAHFREASVAYIKNKFTVNFGIVNTRIFDFQQKFWGKRYLGPEFQAAYGYGSVADLGVVIDYKINDILKVDLSVLNGKGYNNIQVDNSIKTAFGITITTPDRLSFKLYGDIMKPSGVFQHTLIGFAGFKNKLISIGAEASYKSNLDLTTGHNVWGFSATGAIFVSEKSEIFGRYDYSASVVVPGENSQWDSLKDGGYFIGGVQHTFNSNVRIALNYRGTYPYAQGRQDTNAVYFNVHFRF